MSDATVLRWRPAEPAKLELIETSDRRAVPSCLSEHPSFDPVTAEAYAMKIVRDRHVPASGAGHVTRLLVRRDVSLPVRCRKPAGASIAVAESPRTICLRSTMRSWGGS